MSAPKEMDQELVAFFEAFSKRWDSLLSGVVIGVVYREDDRELVASYTFAEESRLDEIADAVVGRLVNDDVLPPEKMEPN